jgi:hypothetical protein
MSSKPVALSDITPSQAATGVRNAALRLAFGLLAANMLVKSLRPPSLKSGTRRSHPVRLVDRRGPAMPYAIRTRNEEPENA